MSDIIGLSSYFCSKCGGNTSHEIKEGNDPHSIFHYCIACKMRNEHPFGEIPIDLVKESSLSLKRTKPTYH